MGKIEIALSSSIAAIFVAAFVVTKSLLQLLLLPKLWYGLATTPSNYLILLTINRIKD